MAFKCPSTLANAPPLLRLLTTATTPLVNTTTAANPFPKLHHHQPLEEAELEHNRESITNRSYWSRKIHSLCSDLGDVDAALHLLDRLRLLGYRPDPLNLASVIHALCDASRFHEAHHRLLLSLATADSPPFGSRTCNVLLSRLLDARSPLLSLRVLKALVVSNPAFTPSPSCFNRLLDQLCSHSHPLHAHRLLLSLKSKGISTNAVTYTTLINGFSRLGEVDYARRLFDEMVDHGILPNSLTYSVLIKAVLRKRGLEEAKEMMQELWVKMETEEDISVNSAAFANLIDALCREGLFHEVFRIAEEMPQGNSVRKEFAYGQMMDSLCRAGRHHGASRIVYIMRKKGFVPSLVSYNCIIHGLSKDRGGMRAYQLFKEGMKFGYAPAEPTYKVLVEALCREMDLQKAKDVAEFMLQKDGIDKTRIYNIFLSSLRLVENPTEQLNVLVSMLQKQCRPDVITLNTVIHGFCKIGRVAEATRIWDDMLKGKFCAPDVVTFTTIIQGLFDEGKLGEALELMRRMPECSCLPNVVTYNAVLHGFCKLKKVDEAMEIFNEMVGKGVSADSTTYTVIIRGLFESSRLTEAKTFWDDVVWPSKIHDDYVYSAILKGLCCSGKLNEACDFVYELADCGVSPGIVNYNILIDSVCRQGLKREAYQIVSEMRKNGLEPDSVTWRILDRMHEKARHATVAGDRSPVCEGNTEKASMPADADGDKKLWGNGEESCGDTLEGLVDPSISLDLVDENNDKGGRIFIKENNPCGDVDNFKFKGKEPLSRIARRVFGIL